VRFGDGRLEVDDIFVTFRRSIDPALLNYVRYWSNGVRVAEVYTNNVFRPQSTGSSGRSTSRQADLPEGEAQPSVDFVVSPIIAGPGQTVQVPVEARIQGPYPVRVLMFNLNVVALGGAPEILTSIQFTPVPGLGIPTFTSSQSPNNYAAAWLDESVAGVAGTSLVGTLTVTTPGNASPNSAYKVEFEHISASPNGLALFPVAVHNGVTLVSGGASSSWGDGITDAWRIAHFNSVSDPSSAADADPDSDGTSNWAEFKAGTNPNDAHSALRVVASQRKDSPGGGLSLHWETVANKTYVVECAPALIGASWTIISSFIPGDGLEYEFTDSNLSHSSQFYRVRVVE
jgi:hypothetical protein